MSGAHYKRLGTLRKYLRLHVAALSVSAKEISDF